MSLTKATYSMIDGAPLNVKDFGAVGDGVADDTAAFTAVGSANVNTIVVPAGRYNLATAPTVTNIATWYIEKGAYFTGAASLEDVTQNIVSLGQWANISGARNVTWLSKTNVTVPNGSTQPNMGWVESNSTFASYGSKGTLALSAAARTSQQNAGASIALTGVGYNDNTTNSVGVRGLYLDSKCLPTALGATWAAEVQITNLGSYVDWYDVSGRKTYGMSIFAGGDPVINGTTEAVTVGLNFGGNGGSFGRGIVFGLDFRVFTDDAGVGHRKAIVMRETQQIGWETSVGDSIGFIRSVINDPTKQTSILFGNDSLIIQGAAGRRAFHVASVGAIENYFFVSAATAGVGPSITTVGSDTNIDLRLVPKGTGNVRFGSRTATSDVPITGYLEIKDSGGTLRKLAIID